MTRDENQKVETLANELYDKYNPRPFVKINVSKDECIKQAMRKLGLKR